MSKCILIWNEAVKTAGVRINNQGQIELCIAPSFWDKMPDNHKMGLLIHELLHLCLNHIGRSKDLNHKIANMAQDIAINQLINKDNLPEGGLLPEQFKLEPNKSFEYYYIKLMEQKQQYQDTLDNHEYNDSSDNPMSQDAMQLTEDIKKNILEQAIQEAAKETKEKYGNVPQHIEQILKEIAQKNKINWRILLRKFIGRNLSYLTEPTRTRPNRRQGFMAEGSKKDYIPKVIIAVDNSGSVSDSECTQLIGEAKGILKNLIDKTEIIYFDTQIQHVEIIDKYTKIKEKRYANGGTCFQCVIDHCKNKKPDMLIVLTDGGAECPEKPRFPVLWAITENGQKDHLYGTKIDIVEGKE